MLLVNIMLFLSSLNEMFYDNKLTVSEMESGGFDESDKLATSA